MFLDRGCSPSPAAFVNIPVGPKNLSAAFSNLIANLDSPAALNSSAFLISLP